MMLESLLMHYGYPALIIGTFLEGETILILGGVAAKLGYLSLEWVIACGFIGTLLGDQLYFFIGRYKGKAFLTRRPVRQMQAQRVFQKLERHQNLFIIGFRFIYGLRTVTPFAIGISNISYLRFTLLNILGAAIWAIIIGLIGYFFGHAFEALLGDIKHYELELLAGIILFSALIWLTSHYRRRRACNRIDGKDKHGPR